MMLIDTLAVVAVSLYLFSRQASLPVWTIVVALVMALLWRYGEPSWLTVTMASAILLVMVLGSIKPLRRRLLTRHIFAIMKKNLPVMSQTERDALEAGTVSYEGDIFSGHPDFDKLQQLPTVALTQEEQQFIDGPVKELCAMIDDWDITHNLTDMPPHMWDFIKKNKFFGMIIPKSYGGLEFSATAQMKILSILYGRSGTVATTVGVPNSLGPAELLLKYGTEAQKNHYLPRLADGREVPCFALTGPSAGSDAASIPDTGVVCYGEFEGKKILGIKLNWDKRYITLSPVATVIGLAFRLFDPEKLLGKTEDLGISCALIPAKTKGVVTGRRHFPLNTAFMNGPTQGRDVFVPMDYLIGGIDRAGQGWRMLMECLSAGRAISLPSSANGGVQVAALTAGAYSRIRRQFGLPIAKFEGIQEPLARIAMNAYIIDAGVSFAAAAIDHGAKPAVAGAILKYHTTERGRQVVMDVMDIHGGKGICLGPNNYLGRGYQTAPIAITVEGANILTRNLIIFGQGAVRCHPYVFKQMDAVRQDDLVAFDKAFFGQAAFTLANFSQSLVFGITNAFGTSAPASSVKRYYQKVRKYSANLAFLADYSMLMLGGALKRKESLSARLGDMLSTLYLASAVLKRFHAQGEPQDDVLIVKMALDDLLYQCETAMSEVISQFPGRASRLLLRLIIKPFGNREVKVNHQSMAQVADVLSTPSSTRDRLTYLAYREPLKNCPVGLLEEAFIKTVETEAIEQKVLNALKNGQLKSLTLSHQIDEAHELGLIDSNEQQLLHEANQARMAMIAVDDFATSDLARLTIEQSIKELEIS